jgi:hypothetical protein
MKEITSFKVSTKKRRITRNTESEQFRIRKSVVSILKRAQSMSKAAVMGVEWKGNLGYDDIFPFSSEVRKLLVSELDKLAGTMIRTSDEEIASVADLEAGMDALSQSLSVEQQQADSQF